MPTALAAARRLLLTLAVPALAGIAPQAAHAEQISYFAAVGGAGNLSVFDPAAGTGGWVGSLDEVPPPVQPLPQPLSLVSVALFQVDLLTQKVKGTFEFTTPDLLSTLYGELTGDIAGPDTLTAGGLFTLDYTIRGGSGAFTDAHGFGLAFLSYDPAGVFNNYSETGLLSFTIPEPGSLGLAGAALLLAGVSRRKARPVN